MPIITNLKPGVKNPGRVNVFIDGAYDFSLTLTQVVDLKVKIGRKLEESELSELRRASAYGKLHQRALEWVLTRPRSVRETRDYLIKKNADPADIEKILTDFLAHHYLDDRSFAEFYVENRFVKKGISRRRLQLELSKKGVASDIIDQVLSASARSDEAEIKKIIERKLRQAKFQNDPDKLIQYITRQGFDYQLVRTLVHETDSQN